MQQKGGFQPTPRSNVVAPQRLQMPPQGQTPPQGQPAPQAAKGGNIQRPQGFKGGAQRTPGFDRRQIR